MEHDIKKGNLTYKCWDFTNRWQMMTEIATYRCSHQHSWRDFGCENTPHFGCEPQNPWVLEFFRDESFHSPPPSVLEIANHAAKGATERQVYPPATGSLTEETCSSFISQHWDWTKNHIHFSWVWFQQEKWHPIIITLHQRVAKLHVSRFSQISRWTEKKTWTTRGHHGFLGHVPMAFHGFPWPCWMVKFRLDGLFIP